MKELTNKQLIQMLIASIVIFALSFFTGCKKTEPLPKCAIDKTATVVLTNTSEQIMYVYINGTNTNLLLAKATNSYTVNATTNKFCLVNYNTLQSRCVSVSVNNCDVLEVEL